MNSLEIKDQREQLKKRALEIVNTCKKEVRDLTEDEQNELQALKEKIKEKDEELKELQQRLEKLSVEDEDGEDKEETKEHNKEKKSNIRKMNKKFSLVKAIRSIANNQPLDDVTMAVINAGKEEARKSGVNAQGQIQLPTEERATISVASEGEDVVATDLFDILTPLRAKNVLVNAGAKFLGNLVGNVQIPTMTASNVYWEGETSSAKDGAGAFSHVTLSPKRLTAYVDISKQLIVQDSIGVEQALRNDLIAAINSKIEATILGDEAGTTTQPEGIFATVTPTAVSTYAQLTDKEADVEDANVLGECVYVMSNKAKAVLRNMAKSTKSTNLVFENGEVDGTKAFNTSNVTGKKYVYGDFSNLAIGTFGGVDILVDPFTKGGDGQIRVIASLYLDAKVLRPEAFVTGNLGE